MILLTSIKGTISSLVSFSETGGGQRLSSIMSSFMEKIRGVEEQIRPSIKWSLQDENPSFRQNRRKQDNTAQIYHIMRNNKETVEKESWEQRQNMLRKELSEVSMQESEREKTKWLKHLTNERRV